MNTKLADVPDFTTAYLDDIAVFSDSWEDHLEHLRTVLQKIRESGLTLKMAKCKWAYHETEFLGHRIGGGHIQPLEAKTEAIKNYIRPNSKKQVHAFLGLSGYYRKFIRNYAGITAPISDLTMKDQTNKFTWTDEAEKAFLKIKEALSTNPILMSSDDRKPYLLQTDASGRGLGAVLNQEDDEGNQRPVAYFSRKLKDREDEISWNAAGMPSIGGRCSPFSCISVWEEVSGSD